jgi:hypothetical protein
MSRLSEQVANANDIETVSVPIPQWGISVDVKGMTGSERSKYLRRLIDAREAEDTDALGELDADLVIACTFDPDDGSKVFLESDKPMLQSKSGFIIGAIAMKAQRLSGLDVGAEERLGKGSSASVPTTPPVVEVTPSVDSSTPSPAS